MRLQDHLVRQTQRALNDLLRAVDALPPEKLDWKPCETSRSVLSQLKEVAMAPQFFIHVIRHGKMPDMTNHAHDSTEKIEHDLVDLASTKQKAMEATAELCSAILDFPDDGLDHEITLPFGGGMVMTMAEILGLHAWNMTYHYGQINYIQTLLGDVEMH